MGYRVKLILWVSEVSDRYLLEVIEDDRGIVLIDEDIVERAWIFPVIPGIWEGYGWHRDTKKSPLQNRGLSG